jgi:hypothetical protein
MSLYGAIKVGIIGYVRFAMQKNEQELPIGYQLPDPYANHPAVLAHEKFLQAEADLPCSHYPMRTQYFCTLCRYEFNEKYIKGEENNG